MLRTSEVPWNFSSLLTFAPPKCTPRTVSKWSGFGQGLVRTSCLRTKYVRLVTQRRAQKQTNPARATLPLAPVSAPLPAQWAFVVQLRQGTTLTPEGLQGRIEHIVSGQATTFSSLTELCAFMEHVLGRMEEKPP